VTLGLICCLQQRVRLRSTPEVLEISPRDEKLKLAFYNSADFQRFEQEAERQAIMEAYLQSAAYRERIETEARAQEEEKERARDLPKLPEDTAGIMNSLKPDPVSAHLNSPRSASVRPEEAAGQSYAHGGVQTGCESEINFKRLWRFSFFLLNKSIKSKNTKLVEKPLLIGRGAVFTGQDYTTTLAATSHLPPPPPHVLRNLPCSRRVSATFARK
jgi:hypothetical protein